MQNTVCLSDFKVSPKQYKKVFVKDIPQEELVEQNAYSSPKDIAQICFEMSDDTLSSIITYNPLTDAPNLYTELAKIQDLRDLSKFVDIYGLPMGISSSSKTNLTESVTILEMDVFTFFEELHVFQNVFNSWYSILRIESEEQSNSLSDTLTLKSITNILNSKRKWIETMDVYNGISLCVYFSNLFEVAYFQLIETILNNKPLRKCHECGSVFEVSHDSQKFCPPKLGKKRSTCENTYKVRKSRLKQKENSN